MLNVYKNIKGNSTGDNLYVVLSKYIKNVGTITLTQFLISNTTTTTDLLCDIYIRKEIGRSSKNEIVYGSYYILKNANIPSSTSLMLTDSKPFVYKVGEELVVKVNGDSAMTGDIILNYE
tara:strand:+ start:623 stop:982 length:360 start_codon:yes stop_codon:yes gene_type:complete